MSTIIRYQPGGYSPTAPARNTAEQWSNGTQPSDPPAGYTAWDTAGNVTVTRALTTDESNLLAAQDTQATQDANRATVQQRIDNGIGQIQTWISNNPNGAVLTAGQTLTLAKLVIGLAKIVRAELNDTTGT